jgi:hypothetical protein
VPAGEFVPGTFMKLWPVIPLGSNHWKGVHSIGEQGSTPEVNPSFNILLVDDVQFFGGKMQTSENFFHTFNELHSNNRQIVVTSDRPPKALPTLQERLRSRLEWGLVADLQAPDFETRVGVLKAKAQRDGIELKDHSDLSLHRSEIVYDFVTDPDLAFVGFLESCNHSQCCGLSTARGA